MEPAMQLGWRQFLKSVNFSISFLSIGTNDTMQYNTSDTIHVQEELVFSQNTITNAGHPIHYWISPPADKPLIILTHAAFLDHQVFNFQLHQLLESFRVLTWDVSGHGLSQPIDATFSIHSAAYDLKELLDATGYTSATLLGVSMGGFIIQEFQLLFPAQVNALIVVGFRDALQPPAPFELFILQRLINYLRIRSYSNYGTILRRMAYLISRNHVTRYYIESAARRVKKEAFFLIWSALKNGFHKSTIHFLACPMLLVCGDHDFLGFKRSMPQWAHRDSLSDVKIVPNAGHVANLDNPEGFNAILADFLDQYVLHREIK